MLSQNLLLSNFALVNSNNVKDMTSFLEHCVGEIFLKKRKICLRESRGMSNHSLKSSFCHSLFPSFSPFLSSPVCLPLSFWLYLFISLSLSPFFCLSLSLSLSDLAVAWFKPVVHFPGKDCGIEILVQMGTHWKLCVPKQDAIYTGNMRPPHPVAADASQDGFQCRNEMRNHFQCLYSHQGYSWKQNHPKLHGNNRQMNVLLPDSCLRW